MSETRVLGAGARKIGGGNRAITPTPPPAPAPAEKPKKRRGRVLLVLIAVIAVVLAAAAGVVLGTGMLEDGDEPVAAPPPEPGIVVTVESLNINLADSRYLRMGFAIQLAEGAQEITTAQATDAAIALFSGREASAVNDQQVRAELQQELRDRLVAIYGEEVLAVYYTEFVTQ